MTAQVQAGDTGRTCRHRDWEGNAAGGTGAAAASDGSTAEEGVQTDWAAEELAAEGMADLLQDESAVTP